MPNFSTEAVGPSIEDILEYEIIVEEEEIDEEELDESEEIEDIFHPAATELKDFGKDIAFKKTEKSAVRFYRGIKPLVAWLDLERDIENPIHADEQDVKDYVKWLVNTDWAVTSRENRVSACQRFYKWAQKEGPLDDHLAEDIELDEYTPLNPGSLEQSRGDTDDYKWIPRDDVVKLWQPENIPSPRLRSELLFKLMWFTSCRCASMSNAKIYPDDPDKGLNREEGYIRVKTLKRGNNQDSHRKIYYPKERIEPLLQQWLDQGERLASSPYASESPYLFLTEKKKQMRPSYISRLVKRAAFNVNENADSPEGKIQEVTGYDVHGNPQWLVTGHTIRHSSLTYLANHTDMDLHMVKKQAGHAKYETTLKYVHDEPDARRKAVNDAWD